MKKLLMIPTVLLIVALCVGCASSVRQTAELQEPTKEALEAASVESENKDTARGQQRFIRTFAPDKTAAYPGLCPG